VKKVKIIELFERFMMAATFAQAGEFKTAVEIMAKKRNRKKEAKNAKHNK
jgi:hypothetical protein